MTSMCVVVPAGDQPSDLAGLLAALKPQIAPRPERRLVVVNGDGHDDDFAAVVRPHLTWMTYLGAPAPLGTAATRNLGAAQSEEDYLVFTRESCRPGPTWLDCLAGILDAAPWADGVAGAVRPLPADPKSWRQSALAQIRPLPGAAHDEFGRLLCASNAAFAVRRSRFVEAGGFDEAFTRSGDDLDLTQRLLRQGGLIETAPAWATALVAETDFSACLRDAYEAGWGAGQYVFTRRDWGHPDLRDYLEDEDALRSVDRRTAALKASRQYAEAGWLARLGLAWAARRIALRYADGFQDAADAFSSAGKPPPRQARWPRLGLSLEGGYARR